MLQASYIDFQRIPATLGKSTRHECDMGERRGQYSICLGSSPYLGEVGFRLFALVCADAIRMAWGEYRFVAGFAESLAAMLLYWTGLIGSVALGIWVGMRAANITSRTWAGWVVGIAVVLIGWACFDFVGQNIPGVDWRFRAMSHSD